MKTSSCLCLMLGSHLARAFVTRSSSRFLSSRRQGVSAASLRTLSFLQSSPEPSSSYEVDSDSDAEQHLGETPVGPAMMGELPDHDANDKHGGRFNSLVASVGLQGKLKHISDLPEKRNISGFDIFCNRELKLDAVRAIGFDMDYTLAQYQQPAFDKLAFDGAKEKLVKKLGYPEAVLDFEYDHEVRKKKRDFDAFIPEE
jgi:hypothetical protein